MQRIKQDEGLSVSLNLPKDLPWRIFGLIFKDLGGKSSEFKGVLGAVRNRDVEKFLLEAARFGPRSMVEKTGLDKAKAFSFYVMYQLGSLLKKYPFPGVDTKKAAIKKFKEAEDTCRRFNSENYKALLALNEKHPDFLGVIEEIRDDIEKLIGDCPVISEMYGHAKHGPGVSLGDLYEGGKCTQYYKYANLPYTVTKGALPYAIDCLDSDPRWIGALDDWYRRVTATSPFQPISRDAFLKSVFKVVEGSRITTVPKTALTDRTIAIEPLMNVFLQLGIDHVLKSRLKRWGFDLSSQKKNQELALEGALYDLLCTLDLSAASDSIALKLCEIFLPAAWYDLLLDLRSPKGQLGEEEITFEKISSMGNGCTFALETLIFGALVRCAIRRTRSEWKSAVYGDDLIVPKTAYHYLVTLLEYSGFTLNYDKSFSSGPFRESCGKDFFLGYDVRPLFLTNKIEHIKDLFYLYNSLVLLEDRLDWTWDVSFQHTKKYIERLIPKNVRDCFYGPKTEDLDTHLFQQKRLLVDKDGDDFYWKIQTVPVKFKHRRYNDFYFRKQMVSLRGGGTSVTELIRSVLSPPEPNWERKRKGLNTGNAFEVTRRGNTLDKSVRCYPVRTGYLGHNLPAYLLTNNN